VRRFVVILALFAAAVALGQAGKSRAKSAPGHVGAADCAGCHADEARAWRKSAHGRHGIAIREPEGGFDGAVGSQWMQAYLKKGPDGYHRIRSRCLDLRKNEWTDVAPVLEAIRGPWPGAAGITAKEVAERSFEVDCSGCHSSASRLRIDPETGKMDSHFGDWSIDCEACHGPGGDHSATWKRLSADAPLVRLAKLSPRHANAICARCHGGPPTDGDFAPEDARHFVAWLKDREGFLADGSASGQVYQYSTFVRSPCFTEGGLTCTGCHDPHSDELRPGPDLDAMCVRCHSDEAAGHTFHDVAKEGARCVNCHMPKLLTGFLAHQRDHRISIPLPASPHVPDACTACHKEEGQDKAWADRAYRKWWGKPSRSTLSAVRAITLARRKDPAAKPLLRRALVHPDPFFRGNAAIYLEDPGAMIDDPSPEARLLGVVAARTVASLRPFLEDSEPRVRSAAMVQLIKLGEDVPLDWRADLEHCTSQLRDLPVPRIMLGVMSLQEKKPQEAQRWFMSALATRPNATDGWLGLATAYEAQGNVKDARAAHFRRGTVLATLFVRFPGNRDLGIAAAAAFDRAGATKEAQRMRALIGGRR